MFNILKYFLILSFFAFKAHSFEGKINENKEPLKQNSSTSNYSFYVGGHLYGTPGPSMYPAASLLGYVSEMKRSSAKFFIMLGDVIQHMKKNQADKEIEIFDHLINKKLNFPLYNAPGNHDLELGLEKYSKYFGEPYYQFVYGTEKFIFLNTQQDGNCNIGKEQENFLFESLNAAKVNDNLKNVFLLMHQPLWLVDNKEFLDVDSWTNTGTHKTSCSDFSRNTLKNIKKLNLQKSLFLLSGDIGCKNYKLGKIPNESFPLFFEKDYKNNITYIATGLCETENDNLIKLNIDKTSNVNIEVISLSGKKLNKIENYNQNYWRTYYNNQISEKERILAKKIAKEKKNAEENTKKSENVSFNQKIISKIKDVLSRKTFYFGFFIGIFSLFIFFLVRFIIQRFKKY